MTLVINLTSLRKYSTLHAYKRLAILYVYLTGTHTQGPHCMHVWPCRHFRRLGLVPEDVGGWLAGVGC